MHQHDHCTPRLLISRRKAQDLSSVPPALHGLELLCRPCRFMSFLKPGGRLLVSDYCRAEGGASQGFAAYIKQRGYDLHSVPAYRSMLEGAGFESVTGEDRTWQVSIAGAVLPSAMSQYKSGWQAVRRSTPQRPRQSCEQPSACSSILSRRWRCCAGRLGVGCPRCMLQQGLGLVLRGMQGRASLTCKSMEQGCLSGLAALQTFRKLCCALSDRLGAVRGVPGQGAAADPGCQGVLPQNIFSRGL